MRTAIVAIVVIISDQRWKCGQEHKH